MKGRSITQIIGIDVEGIYMTMLGIVALFLILKNYRALNALLQTSFRGGLGGLVILQGRDIRRAGLRSV